MYSALLLLPIALVVSSPLSARQAYNPDDGTPILLDDTDSHFVAENTGPNLCPADDVVECSSGDPNDIVFTNANGGFTLFRARPINTNSPTVARFLCKQTVYCYKQQYRSNVFDPAGNLIPGFQTGLACVVADNALSLGVNGQNIEELPIPEDNQNTKEVPNQYALAPDGSLIYNLDQTESSLLFNTNPDVEGSPLVAFNDLTTKGTPLLFNTDSNVDELSLFASNDLNGELNYEDFYA